MTKRPPGAPIPPRSSRNPDRRSLHLNLTAREYTLISMCAAIADLSRPRYVRDAALAVQIYRTTSPTELLASTSRAIACVQELARMVGQNLDARRGLHAASIELQAKAAKLGRYSEEIAALLALLPPESPSATDQSRRLPGPGSSIWQR
jgi:hypothetical protein